MHKPLTKKQIKDFNRKLSSGIKNKDLIFILQDVIDPINVGSLFRLADALNAKLYLTGQTPVPPDKKISMTARGLDRSVKWEYFDTFEGAVNKLRSDKFEIIGLELSENSSLYSEYAYRDKTAVVLGSEAHGIYKKNLDLLDAIVSIPMLGKGPSLNVNVAAAIIGYELIRRV